MRMTAMKLGKLAADVVAGIYGGIVATVGLALATVPMFLWCLFTGNFVAAAATPFYMAYALFVHGIFGGTIATAANNHNNGDKSDTSHQQTDDGEKKIVGTAAGIKGTLLTPFRLIRQVLEKIYSFQIPNEKERNFHDANLSDIYNVALGKTKKLAIDKFRGKYGKDNVPRNSYIDQIATRPVLFSSAHKRGGSDSGSDSDSDSSHQQQQDSSAATTSSSGRNYDVNKRSPK